MVPGSGLWSNGPARRKMLTILSPEDNPQFSVVAPPEWVVRSATTTRGGFVAILLAILAHPASGRDVMPVLFLAPSCPTDYLPTGSIVVAFRDYLIGF